MRIGFIAMSGVRAHNEEVTRLGLTMPGFIERNKIIASLPSLSLLTLAGLTPEDYEVTYLEIADLRKQLDLPEGLDLVAISSFSAQIHEAYEVADRYQAMDIPVVMGGLHVTSEPEEALRHCASVVIGEGELVWSDVIRDAKAHNLKRIYTSDKPGGFDLRRSPVPRFDLLDPAKYNRITIQTSRGCPHKCEFCASSILLTPDYKTKPVDRVLAEIETIKRIWPKPFIEFADDNSFVDRRYYRELLRQMAPHRLRWFTESDINIARDDEMLSLMRDAGCQQVLIGLESPSFQSLGGIELVSNWKQKQLERYAESITKIQSYGITVNGCFILGLDGDSSGIFEHVHDFAIESGLYDVQVTLLTPFPGTPLYDRLRREGRLMREKAWELCTLFDLNVIPRGMTVDELQEGFLWLVKTLYTQEATNLRRRKFRENLRESPNYSRTGRDEEIT